MWECNFAGERMDYKLFWLRFVKKIWLILAAAAVGALLIGGSYYLINITLKHYFLNVFPEIVSSIVMALVSYLLLSISDGIALSFVWITISIIVYFAVLMLFPGEKILIIELKGKILKKNN